MNIFEELEISYSEIFSIYAKFIDDAKETGDMVLILDYTRKKEHYENAFFLFIFTRLEDSIRNIADNLLNEKALTLKDWHEKRTWEILNDRKDRIAFMDKVALLIEKNGKDYRLIEKYFKQRNNIAHGGTFTIPIQVHDVIADMKMLNTKINNIYK